MVGENELGPPADFSVGETEGELDAGADDGVEVVFGPSLVSLPQPAVSAPIATIAEAPTRSVTRRTNRLEAMTVPICAEAR